MGEFLLVYHFDSGYQPPAQQGVYSILFRNASYYMYMKVNILYTSTSGNTHFTAQIVQTLLREHHLDVTLCDVATLESFSFVSDDVYVFACGTYGHGVLPAKMQHFLDRIDTVDLKHIPCAVIGLGDRRYDAQYVCESATLLQTWIENRGGALIQPSLRIDGHPIEKTQTNIHTWSQTLTQIIQT